MYQQYIGGKLVTGLGKPLEVLDPSPGEVVGTVGSANAAQAQQALDAAAEYRFIRTVSVYGSAVLPLLAAKRAPGGGVLCETEREADLPEQAGSLTLVKQYNYGKIKVSRYERGEEV